MDSGRCLESSRAWRWACRAISVAELKAVVAKVERLEKEGAIAPWQEYAQTPPIIPEGEEPPPGEILPGGREYPYLGAKEIQLANGMRICYKRTDFLGDQAPPTSLVNRCLSM